MSKKILIVGHAGHGIGHSCVSSTIAIEEALKRNNFDCEIISPEKLKEMGMDISKIAQINEPPDLKLSMLRTQNYFSRPLTGKEKRFLRRKQNRKKK